MIYRVYRGIYRGIIYIVCKMRKKCYNVTKGSKMKESKVERRLVTKIKDIGGKAYKWESPGNAGVPDRIIITPAGKVIFVETKRPKGGVLSSRQKNQIRNLIKLKQDVRVITNYEQVDEFIKEITIESKNST